MRTPILLATLISGLSALSSTAFAAACGQLTILNRVDMQYGPSGRQIIVPVTLNDMEASFLVDTGGITTAVSRRLAERLNLPIHKGTTTLYGMAGTASNNFASINTFSIGRLHTTYRDFPVLPGIGSDGLLSLNFMQGYDIDFDFANNLMNFFSQDHCPGAVVYWTSTATGVVPITMHDNHMTVPVVLDGHEFTAIIDTGSTSSTLSMDIAQDSYGLTLGSADTPEQGILNGNRTLKTYHHIFGSLIIGDITIRNADLTIIPDAMRQIPSGDS